MSSATLPESRTRGGRRFAALTVLVPAVFVLVYFGARLGIERIESGSTAALLVALAPVPFFALLIYGYVRTVRGMDELARRIQLEALTIAFPCALVVAFTAGLLDLAGFHGRGDWDLPRLWPLLLLPYWIGLALAHRRYQ
jgi:hypothetical protein